VTENTVSSATVHKIAALANIPVTAAEEQTLTVSFNETLDVIAHMSQLDTQNIQPTYQVTGLENVWRNDEVEEKRIFSQEQALANASKTYQGYFVVPQVIDQD